MYRDNFTFIVTFSGTLPLFMLEMGWCHFSVTVIFQGIYLYTLNTACKQAYFCQTQPFKGLCLKEICFFA